MYRSAVSHRSRSCRMSGPCYEPIPVILGSTRCSRLFAADFCGGDAGVLHRAPAGYAASILGDGLRLHHLQRAHRGDALESRLSHSGNADRRGGDDRPGPEPRQRARIAQPRHRAVGRHLPVPLADRRHTAQLRLHVGRLHRGAARVSGRIDATIDFRHRRGPRAGNHARNHLCERRCDARAAAERRLCNCGTSGRLARRCASTRHRCPHRSWQQSGA